LPLKLSNLFLPAVFLQILLGEAGKRTPVATIRYLPRGFEISRQYRIIPGFSCAAIPQFLAKLTPLGDLRIRSEILDNGSGRKEVTHPERAFTQSPEIRKE
jgi:hypothetical protein